jgi:hypothetical protein
MGIDNNRLKSLMRTRVLILAAFFAALLCSVLVMALTPAGVVIRNQATATYLDSNNDTQSTSSNQVSTTVQEVLGLTLVADQTKFAVEDSTVYFPHFLTNAGNATESYVICLDQTGLVDQFDTTLSLFLDADEDGLPDTPGTPLTSTTPSTFTPSDGCYLVDPLDGGDAVQVVVQAVIADETPDLNIGDQSLFQITAYTDTGFDDPLVTGLTDTDTDTIEITDTPIIEVIKSLDTDQGLSPSGPYTVTLTYRNTGTTDAQDLRIEEILPTTTFTGDPGGMLYVAGTAQWSHEGATAVSLTDADETDVQTDGSGRDILFCAYDVSCDTGTAPLDFEPTKMVAIIDSVPAGEEGTITFQVNIESGIAESEALVNVVSFVYYDITGPNLIDDGGDDFVSNSVTFVIIADSENPGVVANDTNTVADTNNITEGADDALDTNNIVYDENSYDGMDPLTSVIEQNGTAVFYNYIWNSGDGTDTFDITIDNVFQRDRTTLLATPFPAGTTFNLFRPDGVNTLIDTDGDSIPDTGPLDAGESYLVILEVTPPGTTTGDNSGFGWDVTLIATSSIDTNLSNAVTDHLQEITTSEIDLTNAEVRDPATCDVAVPPESCNGEGDGPKSSPANDYLVANGASITVPLWSHNIGQASDAFDLTFSDTNSPFTPGSIPAGWTIEFYDVGGANNCDTLGSLITNTGNISGGSEILACALVTIDANVNATDEWVDIYFRALSPATAEFDIKYDRVKITPAPAIEITPDQSGQVSPGQFITYAHTVSNTGNADLECVSLTAVNDLAGDGWTVAIYLDVNEDSQLDAGDTLYTDQVLAVGDSFPILTRVFAPVDAADGTLNTTNIDVNSYIDDNDGNPATCGGAIQAADSAIDLTNVTDADVTILKQQAPDENCDGVADSAFSTVVFYVDPGKCAVYQLTTVNSGAENMFNVEITDSTPPFTTYRDNAESCSYTDAASPPLLDCGIGVVPASATFEMEPADGATGVIQWYTSELISGGSMTATFGIRVD